MPILVFSKVHRKEESEDIKFKSKLLLTTRTWRQAIRINDIGKAIIDDMDVKTDDTYDIEIGKATIDDMNIKTDDTYDISEIGKATIDDTNV